MSISVTLHNNTHVACENRLQTTHTQTETHTTYCQFPPPSPPIFLFKTVAPPFLPLPPPPPVV